MGASAAGIRFVVHLHDVPLLSQAAGHHLRFRLIGHIVEQSAVLSRQDELRPGHPGLCQKRSFAAACRRPGRVKHLVGGSVRQERPGSEGLGSRQAQGADGLILVKAQELGAGRRRPEGSGCGRHMPSQIPVGGYPQGHSDPGHGLIAADHGQQKLVPGFPQVFRHTPGRGHHHGADVGLGIRVHVVQLQGVAHHGVHEDRGEQRHPLPGSPDMSAPFIAAYLQIIAQHILNLRVFFCADGHSHGVQNAQVRSFFDKFRYIFRF